MDDPIIAEMKAYLEGFVEKPHPAFHNLPVCPFAKKARIENKLTYKVMELQTFDALRETLLWDEAKDGSHALIMVHPNKDLSWDEYVARSRVLSDCLEVAELGLSLFAAHPESDFQEHGVYTRREPYPNWQVMRVSELERAQAKLRHSKWYDWSRSSAD